MSTAWLKTVGGWVWEIRRLPVLLDWLLKVAEPLVALGFAGVFFYLGGRIVLKKATPDEVQLINSAAENWKIVALVLVPLFYRTVRIFLEEVREWAGMKREPKQGIQETEDTRTRR